MKITVIIPIYNTEKFLPDCIESVINQTYKDIEIILVNDGSSGNEDNICKKYASQDLRIKYFSKENEGAAIARNLGIANATGDYIFCLDSDDTISPTFIQEIFKSVSKSNCDLLTLGNRFSDTIDKIGCLPTWGFAVKREFLIAHPDIRFQPYLAPCEDGLFTHKIIALTDNIGKCPKAIYNYRYNPASVEHTLDKQRVLNDIPKWYEILEDFYNKYHLWDKKSHLLAFINNEPFDLRFCNMNFNNKERKEIFDITHKFIKKYHLDTVNDKIIKGFSYDFYNFVKSSSYYEYQIKKHLLYDILEKIFSVKYEYNNEFKHKVITICFMKFKLKVGCIE